MFLKSKNQMDSFNYLGGCISPTSRVYRKLIWHSLTWYILGFGMTYALLARSWVYATTMRLIVLHGSDIWPSRLDDMRSFHLFEHPCLGSIGRIWWENFVGNQETRLEGTWPWDPTLQRGHECNLINVIGTCVVHAYRTNFLLHAILWSRNWLGDEMRWSAN